MKDERRYFTLLGWCVYYTLFLRKDGKIRFLHPFIIIAIIITIILPIFSNENLLESFKSFFDTVVWW